MIAPFPYFGGKSSIAHRVWAYLGDVKHYLEPFFGSGAVLLNRPNYDPKKHIESVCDIDGFLCNAWRSIQFQPKETAKWCDWPVNHIDLMARRKDLIKNENSLVENLINNSEWCDPKLGGYWIWAASCWIGRGLTKSNGIPHLIHGGKGVHKLSLVGQRPHLSDGGNGVHKVSLGGKIYEWFEELSQRLRRVRVVCGGWEKICGRDWQDKEGICGIFFDPPYASERYKNIYHRDSMTVALEVGEWALERGKRNSYRIVIAGYDDEYSNLIEAGWKTERWTARGGYGNQGNKKGKENKHREMLFISPHCLNQQENNLLFD